MKILRITIICLLGLYCSLYLQKCFGQYILGQMEPPDNYVFQVLLNENEAIEHIFAECDEVVAHNLDLSQNDKKYFLEMYGIDIEKDNFRIFTGLKGKNTVRHAIILDCKGCFRPITFILSIDPDGWINDINVMVYRESRGGEVANERFLGQFKGKNIETLDNIDTAVTGATASAKCLCSGTKKGLLLLQELFHNKRFSLNKLGSSIDKTVTTVDEKGKTNNENLKSFTQMQWIEDYPAIISVWHSSEQEIVGIFEKVFNEMKRVNNLINSEVKKLNRKGRKKLLQYSKEFSELIFLCKKYSVATQGLFDIAIVDDNKKTSYNDILVNGDKIAFANKYIKIDLSLVRKGYIIDKVIEILKKNRINIAAINYGDTTRVIGKPPGKNDWKIGIRYLDQKDLILGHVSITDRALSVTTNPCYCGLNTLRVNNSVQLTNSLLKIDVSENLWASVVAAESALESVVFSYVSFLLGHGNNASSSLLSNIDFVVIYNDSKGKLQYEASQWMKERFYQKIGSIKDYNKVPVCACEVN